MVFQKKFIKASKTIVTYVCKSWEYPEQYEFILFLFNILEHLPNIEIILMRTSVDIEKLI